MTNYASLFAPNGIAQGAASIVSGASDAFRTYADLQKQKQEAEFSRAKFEEAKRQFNQQQALQKAQLQQQAELAAKSEAGTQKRFEASQGERAREFGAMRQEADTSRKFDIAKTGINAFQAPEANYGLGSQIASQAKEAQDIDYASKGILKGPMYSGNLPLTGPISPGGRLTPAGQAFMKQKEAADLARRKEEAQIQYLGESGKAREEAAKDRSIEGIKAGLLDANSKLAQAKRDLMINPKDASAKLNLADAQQEVSFWQYKLRSMYPGEMPADAGPGLFNEAMNNLPDMTPATTPAASGYQPQVGSGPSAAFMKGAGGWGMLAPSFINSK